MMSSSNDYNNRSVVMMESEQCASPKGVNQGLKKGPWTAPEDAILIEYVKKHGEGNWNSVQKNSRLRRCGKSCRLRWANHLRPNLKKGSFTPDEERIIIELHAQHGNKWARMASQLPGRTDNEIKNYWNTRMKRRQRAGLPVYPQDFQPEGAAAAFQFHHQQKDRQSHVQPNSSSTSLFSSSLHNLSNLSLLNPINNFFLTPLKYPLQNHLSPPISFYSNPSDDHDLLRLFVNTNNTNDGNLPPSPSPVSPYEQSPAPSTHLFNIPNPTRQEIPINTPPSLFYDDADMDNNIISFTSLIMMGAHQVQPIDHDQYFSSYQTPPPGPTTNSDGGACAVLEASDKININACEESTGQQGMDQGNRDNSGLLDALLQEAKSSISCKGKSICDHDLVLINSSNEGKRAMDRIIKEEGAEEEDSQRVKLLSLTTNIGSENSSGREKFSEDFSSSHSSYIGILKVPSEEAEGDHDEMNNSMDDELISLLNHFPSSEPLTEWYHQIN